MSKEQRLERIIEDMNNTGDPVVAEALQLLKEIIDEQKEHHGKREGGR